MTLLILFTFDDVRLGHRCPGDAEQVRGAEGHLPQSQRQGGLTLARSMTSRLQRTEDADLPRLAGIDQADLRDLRTPRPAVDVLQRTYDQPGEPVA